MRVIWSDPALSDVEGIREYIAKFTAIMFAWLPWSMPAGI
jgi:hypothetical protein